MPTVPPFSPAAPGAHRFSACRVGSGLTSRQAWALEHITRCPSCGKWVLVTERALRLISSDGYVPAAVCDHFRAEG